MTINFHISTKALDITNGTAVNVTWKRANANEQIKYFYEDGTQVSMNVGKTYIAVVPETFDIMVSALHVFYEVDFIVLVRHLVESYITRVPCCGCLFESCLPSR